MTKILQYFTLLWTILPLALCVSKDNSFCSSKELDNRCAHELHKSIAPMMIYFRETNEKMKLKNEKIAQLEENHRNNRKLEIDELVGQVGSLTGQINKLVGVVNSLSTQISSLTPLLDSFGQLKNELKESNQVVQVLKESVHKDSQTQNKIQKTTDSLSSQISELRARLGISTENKQNLPKSCDDVKDYSGTLLIQPKGSSPFMVSCDSKLAGSGWTVIQRRIDGSVNFYRNWIEYKQGFGDVEKEYFIGLDRLHQMTKGQRHELYIHLVDQSNEVRYARYDNFVVENEDKKFELSSVGKFSGNVADSFGNHKGMKFSTVDSDNDIFSYNCAIWVKGGWWYFHCADSNLNGNNFSCTKENSNDLEDTGCIYWQHWHGRSYSLKNVQMMIRPWKRQ